jgi:hypothetical protein
MAGRFINPLPQFMDSTPTMYAGAKLFFYATGTSTKLNTYTTKDLSVANSNPVVLDSAGRIPNDIFLQDLEYKVVLAPSTDTDPPTSPIWTADPVSHRDSALVAKTLTGSGSPNGAVAGTAGSASILPDFYWDYTNSILYVCTTTGTSSTAVWTAVNASAATPSVPPPQGRLTLTSATPILTTDAASATAVLYTPYIGNLVPIYNGASMAPTEFSELTLTLSSSHALSTIYDVFVFSNSGVLTLATGPAWTASTAGSGNRGSGASTSQLTRIKGLWVNAVSMTGRNGSTTYSIGANLATYLGSIFIDGTAGQISCDVSSGQTRKWGVWNAYNRMPITLRSSDPTASWTYATNTFRVSRGDTNNLVRVFNGLAEEYVHIEFKQHVAVPNSAQPQIGIGVNSTTVRSGMLGHALTLASGEVTIVATHSITPSLGVHAVSPIEINSTTSATYYGAEAKMLLTAQWRA